MWADSDKTGIEV